MSEQRQEFTVRRAARPLPAKLRVSHVTSLTASGQLGVTTRWRLYLSEKGRLLQNIVVKCFTTVSMHKHSEGLCSCSRLERIHPMMFQCWASVEEFSDDKINGLLRKKTSFQGPVYTANATFIWVHNDFVLFQSFTLITVTPVGALSHCTRVKAQFTTGWLRYIE